VGELATVYAAPEKKGLSQTQNFQIILKPGF
jgi:hypothetical protein